MSNPTKMIFGAFFRLEKKATPSWFRSPSTQPNFWCQFYCHFFVVFFKISSKRLPHRFVDIFMVFDWYLYSFVARKSMLVVQIFSSRAQKLLLRSPGANDVRMRLFADKYPYV